MSRVTGIPATATRFEFIADQPTNHFGASFFRAAPCAVPRHPRHVPERGGNSQLILAACPGSLPSCP
eukprot:979038-Pyramimonas_sp.AAC.2